MVVNAKLGGRQINEKWKKGIQLNCYNSERFTEILTATIQGVADWITLTKSCLYNTYS